MDLEKILLAALTQTDPSMRSSLEPQLAAGTSAAHELMASMTELKTTALQQLAISRGAIKRQLGELRQNIDVVSKQVKAADSSLGFLAKMQLKSQLRTLKSTEKKLEARGKEVETLISAAASMPLAKMTAWAAKVEEQVKLREGLSVTRTQPQPLQKAITTVTTRKIADLGALLAATKGVAQLASNQSNSAAKKSMISIANRAEKLKAEIDKATASTTGISPKLAESFTTRTLQIEQDLMTQRGPADLMKEFRNWIREKQQAVPGWSNASGTDTYTRNEARTELNRALSKANNAVVQIYDKVKNNPTPEGVAKLQEAITAAKKEIEGAKRQ